MKLFQRLYNMVWLSVATLMVFPRWFGKWSAIVHVGVGLALLVLARANVKHLSALPVPERVLRIAKAVVATTTLVAVIGVIFGGLKHYPGIPEWAGAVAGGFHVFIGLAILSQSSSLATAYDMWEEKEIGPAAAAAPTAPTAPPAT